MPKYLLVLLPFLILSCAHIRRDIYMDDMEYERMVQRELAPIRSMEEWNEIPDDPTERSRDFGSLTHWETEPKVFKKISQPDLRHIIRIGLFINKKNHTFTPQNEVTLRIKKKNTWSSKIRTAAPITITRDNSRMLILVNNKRYFTESSLQIIPTNPRTGVTIDGDESYRGYFEVRLNSSHLTLINELPIEEYLRGVLPHEMGHRKENHLEALRAQAISARTYTYKHLNSRKQYHFDLFADVRDQMYKGINSEYGLSDFAVMSTKGVVITHSDTLIDAYYHSTCGGRTASIHNVWPNASPTPYLITAPDTRPDGTPWCSQSRFVNWTLDWKRSEIITNANNYLKKTNSSAKHFSRLDRLEIFGWTHSGRIKELRLNTNSGNYTVTSDKSRWALRRPGNKSILMSSRFKLQKTKSGYRAIGKGFGHGIGFCQMGAMSRSGAGQPYEQIIKAYYSGTELVELE
ncbi:MAG: SpoIID/LytB domain-containing protein [Fibrobacterales bacterium]